MLTEPFPVTGVRARRAGFIPLSILLCGAVLGGCAHADRDLDIPVGDAYVSENFTHDGPLPASFQRVGVLPMHSRIWTEVEMRSLETAFAAELSKFDRFELAIITPEELEELFGEHSFASSEALPADLFARLSAVHGLDGILFLDLTHYQPYQPIGMGVRSKLVDIHDGRILWSFDDTFDLAQPGVAVAARRYYLDNSRQTYPLGHTSGILQSPSRFAKYVAHAMFRTLPPRDS